MSPPDHMQKVSTTHQQVGHARLAWNHCSTPTGDYVTGLLDIDNYLETADSAVRGFTYGVQLRVESGFKLVLCGAHSTMAGLLAYRFWSSVVGL